MNPAHSQAIVHHADPIAPIILSITGILFFAILGRIGARKLNQPTVLGELVMGIIVGNLLYYLGVEIITLLREGPGAFDILGHVLSGKTLQDATTRAISNPNDAQQILKILQSPNGNAYLHVAQVVDGFSRYGVIFMLFLVGLESNIQEIKASGGAALRVAMMGVIAPIVLGFLTVKSFMPHLSLETDLFIAATLSATSVGITARVLKDIRKSNSKEAHVILGAAVIDDILALMILAIVTGMILSGQVELLSILKTITLASLFILATFLLSPRFLRGVVYVLRHMDILEAKLFISFIFVMALAWFANFVGLATIIGAFAAGLILHDGYFKHWGNVEDHSFTIRDLVAPLEAVLVPIFFILLGIQVKLESFLDTQVLFFASVLVIVAIAGKLICGFFSSKDTDRLAIGIGMLPRGEVGLVFATLGKTLKVIPDALFSAIVLMVIVTTLMTPPLLLRRFRGVT